MECQQQADMKCFKVNSKLDTDGKLVQKCDRSIAALINKWHQCANSDSGKQFLALWCHSFFVAFVIKIILPCVIFLHKLFISTFFFMSLAIVQ